VRRCPKKQSDPRSPPAPKPLATGKKWHSRFRVLEARPSPHGHRSVARPRTEIFNRKEPGQWAKSKVLCFTEPPRLNPDI
jgi:hypothetical protein